MHTFEGNKRASPKKDDLKREDLLTPPVKQAEDSMGSASSVVSSEEQYDQVASAPIDSMHMGQHMKRQATMCPVHPKPNH